MIAVSDAYKEIMESNIRPKCEPVITVSGTSNTGEEIHLEWRGKNIKSMTYKRGIDPAGRTLPYMELEWTEIYTGKFNAQNYPEKYANVTKYMLVTLSFEQSYGFFSTWKSVYSKDDNMWKDLYTNATTWKQVKNDPGFETVTVPKLFLSATPTVEGKTIKWKAADLLSFLTDNQTVGYNIDGGSGTKISYMVWQILNTSNQYLNSPDLIQAIDDTMDYMRQAYLDITIKDGIILDGSAKDLLLNLFAAANPGRYLDFQDNKIILKQIFSYSPTGYNFTNQVLYAYPTITYNRDISAFSLKTYKSRIMTEKKRTETVPCTIYEDKENEAIVYFDEYSILTSDDNPFYISNCLTYAIVYTDTPTVTVNIIPVSYQGNDVKINTNKNGEVYVEDNPLNVFEEGTQGLNSRMGVLEQYFSETFRTLEALALANPAIEPGDVIEMETNLYNGEIQATLPIVVLNLEITYDGAMKEKIIAKETYLG